MNKSNEQLEKEKKRSILLFGIVFIVLGVLFAAAIISGGEVVGGIIAGLIFIAAGCVLLNLDRIQTSHYNKAHTAGTKEYERKQQALSAQAQKVYDRAHNHRSLHDEMNFRLMAIAGGVFGGLLLLNLIILFASGYIYWILIIITVCALAFFIYTLTGKEYKLLIEKYAAVNANEQMAEQDFATASIYRGGSGGALIIGERYTVVSDKGKQVILSDTINWVFGRKQWVYNYTNGIYTGRSDRFFIYIATKDGALFEQTVDEAAMYVIIDDFLTRFPTVTAGYTPELEDIYHASPADFSSAVKPSVDRYTIIEPTPQN
ncbi:MAG: hypothetical protein IJ251_06885 [Oscillospiraceae bacterium]|nr:hypothetical protein [Oscillospiraceae bacterium]